MEDDIKLGPKWIGTMWFGFMSLMIRATRAVL